MNDNEEKVDLKTSILSRIEGEKVCPRSRWAFRSHEAGIWLLWVGSVVIGSLAVAVSLFVLSYRQYALYEATHENFYTFVIEALPYLWIILFGVMAFVAVYNLRHTKHGYRYPVWQILGSSLVVSLAGGAALQFFGFGYAIDHELGEQMTMYSSQEKLERRAWQVPEEGRLLGRRVEETIESTQLVFEDVSGGRWVMDSVELPPRDIELLESNELVRVLGKNIDEKLKLFHLCGVFPWTAKPDIKLQQLSYERERFVEHARQHLRNIEERMEFEVDGDEPGNTEDDESVCDNIPAFKRIELKRS